MHAFDPRAGRAILVSSRYSPSRCIGRRSNASGPIKLNALSNVGPIHCAVTEKPGSVLIETAKDWESSSVVYDVRADDRELGARSTASRSSTI